ncbi:uncharacterized protein LOC62_02G003149 [Vanrija pseudolonga]|uniref:Uncharacterized protein n=1 Tax=Vanrija pseudolonga TaxID=143232 RepID=A0AAF1BKH3_9TREE|nr:hypothetical protein LOC62_02G003149 [Vanrija pseudolonga]
MAFSVGNLIHRTIVFGSLAFGIYGTVVIGQNVMVKRDQIKLAMAQQRAEAQAAAAAGGPPPEASPAPTASA